MSRQYYWKCLDCPADEDNTPSSTEHQVATMHAITEVQR